MQLNLDQTQWDCCVVGNGVSALWVAHWLWSSKKSVLWVTSEEPYSSERAMFQHGWLWNINGQNAQVLSECVTGFSGDHGLSPFETIYFDARTSKRFRRYGEAKQEFGDHEKEFFEKEFGAATIPAPAHGSEKGATLASGHGSDKRESIIPAPVHGSEKGATIMDAWGWHAKLHAFHDTGQVQGPTQVELFSEPRFVRVQGWPLNEIKTENGKISSIVFASTKKETGLEIKASQFFLSDFDEPLSGLIKNHDDSHLLAAAVKGRAYRAGFGIKFWHKEFEQFPVQTAIIPLIVNPSEKGAGSHVVGRFLSKKNEAGETLVESLWIGLLTDDEVEDNNEILKKIKQTRRAIDRAVPGFSASITRESVTFEPRMRGFDLVKRRKVMALGAVLLSDHSGPQVASEIVKNVFTGKIDESEAFAAEDLAKVDAADAKVAAKEKTARTKKDKAQNRGLVQKAAVVHESGPKI